MENIASSGSFGVAAGPNNQQDDSLGALIERLRAVFKDLAMYKMLLSYKGIEAQQLLDTFQWLLDLPQIDTAFQRNLVVASQRLSKKSGLYPVCYELNDVVQEGQHPLIAGGFADIYKGNFEGQVVALKVIRVYQTTQIEHLLKHISKEAILWGQLTHPNVLPIYGLYRFQSRICLVAPWMEGGDITQYLNNRPTANRVHLASDVANGLAYLHRIGMIHGDLKGPNILVDSAGRARLADFGLSSISDPDILAWTSHSSAASKGGSVRWQAPELFDVENDSMVKNSKESDVYAWACIFTGNVPFPNILRDSTITLQVKSGARPTKPDYSSPPWRSWGLKEPIWTLMQECWAEDSKGRPTIEMARSRLLPDNSVDNRSSGNDILLPALFRKKFNNPSDNLAILSIVEKIEIASVGMEVDDGVLDFDSDDSNLQLYTESFNADTSLVLGRTGPNPSSARGQISSERPVFDHEGGMIVSQRNLSSDNLRMVTDDLNNRILDWKGPSDLGDLYLHEILSVRRESKIRDFVVYLFQRAMICVVEVSSHAAGAERERAPTSLITAIQPTQPPLRLKGRIYIHQIKSVSALTSKAGEHGLEIEMKNFEINSNFYLFFNDQDTMIKWKGRLENLMRLPIGDGSPLSETMDSTNLNPDPPLQLESVHPSPKVQPPSVPSPSPPAAVPKANLASRHGFKTAMRRFLGGTRA
ncbi:hypothetical protein H0H87_001506 [Tephrocybe sp. NHM501043]|nr:hypothetical protein H0H87_001506 [Tephrocybe sp. NHM501043]